jgi:hypothetical protein
VNGTAGPLDRPAAIAQLEAFTIATEKAQGVYYELLEMRHAAAVNAKRAGVSINRIAQVLGVSRQAVTEALQRRDDA